MALQIPNAPQLEADPYARSRSAFNEILNVFKEQRALKQNAKLMAQKFEYDKDLLAIRADLELENEVQLTKLRTAGQLEVEGLRAYRDAQKAQRDYLSEMYKELSKQGTKKSDEFKKRLEDYKDVWLQLDSRNIPKLDFDYEIDTETGQVNVFGTTIIGGERVVYSGAEIDQYFSDLDTSNRLAKFIKNYKELNESGKLQKETVGNLIGGGEDGFAFIQSLVNGDPTNTKKVLDENVAPHVVGYTGLQKEMREIDKKIAEHQLNLSSYIRQNTLGSNISYKEGTNTLIAGNKRFEFGNKDVLTVLNEIDQIEKGFWKFDGMYDDDINALKEFSNSTRRYLNDYIQSFEKEGPYSSVEEFFSENKHILNLSSFDLKPVDASFGAKPIENGQQATFQKYGPK
jgi:hypothetical protein